MARLELGPEEHNAVNTAALAHLTPRARNKGDIATALGSALYYARQRDHEMHVYEGNAYMHRVWRVSDKASEYLDPINNTGALVFVVHSTGAVGQRVIVNRNPLEPGSSRDVIGRNIERELKAGKPRKQAEAIALENARRTARKNPSPNDERAAALFAELEANRDAWASGKYGWDRFELIQRATWTKIDAEPLKVREHVWLLVHAMEKARKNNEAERLSWKKNPAPLSHFDKAEVDKGIAEETKEHGKKLAPRVVADHLALDPHYYSRKKGAKMQLAAVVTQKKVTVEETTAVVAAKAKKNPAPKQGLQEWGYVWRLDCIDPKMKPFTIQLGQREWIMWHDPEGQAWPKNEALVMRYTLTDTDQVDPKDVPRSMRKYAGRGPIYRGTPMVPSSDADWKLAGVVHHIWYERVGEKHKGHWQHPYGEHGEPLPQLYVWTYKGKKFYRLCLGKGAIWNVRGFVKP